MEERIEVAHQAAMEAFWKKMSQHFPEVLTGDFSPEAVNDYNIATKEAIYRWLIDNHPQGADLRINTRFFE